MGLQETTAARSVVDDAGAGATPTVPAPRDGLPNPFCTAINLGWWMADFYQYLQPRRFEHAAAVTEAPTTLTDLGRCPPLLRARMFLDGVECAVHDLAAATPTSALATRRCPATALAREHLAVPDARDVDVPELRLAADALHLDLLSWLIASDRRLGHAYLLGRLLADSTRDHAAHPEMLRDHFAGPRIQQTKWLRELSSELPPYSAQVVVLSMNMWAQALRVDPGPAPGVSIERLAHKTMDQGEVWRSLLTGGLDARELLTADDYIGIAHEVVVSDRRLLARLVRDTVLPLGGALLAVLVPLVAVLALTSTGSPTVRGAAALVAVGGGMLGVWKTLSAEAVKAMSVVNHPLYEQFVIRCMADRASASLEIACTPAAGQVRSPAGRTSVPLRPSGRGGAE